MSKASITQGGMLKCSKHKDKKEQGENSESANFAVDDLHLVEKKDLDKEEVRRIWMAGEILVEKNYYQIIVLQPTCLINNTILPPILLSKLLVNTSLLVVIIVSHGSVKFQAKLPAIIFIIVLYNVIHITGLRTNLVSLRALYKEDMSIRSARL